jgi:hypothetical protein
MHTEYVQSITPVHKTCIRSQQGSFRLSDDTIWMPHIRNLESVQTESEIYSKSPAGGRVQGTTISNTGHRILSEN